MNRHAHTEKGKKNVMKILVVNDDGYRAEGIAALARILQNEHEVFVCAPKENMSAVGHGLTIRRLLTVEKVELPDCERISAYCVDGTPVDCVRMAIGNLGFVPDLVLSGINQAPNLGTDIISSGTVAAAKEAAMLGYRAIAVSRDEFTTDYFDDVAEVFLEMLNTLLRCFDESCKLLNVNFPFCPRGEYRGIRTGYLAEQVYPVAFDEVRCDDGVVRYKSNGKKLTVCSEEDTSDEKYVRDRFITVTPLKYDETYYRLLSEIKPVIERNF